MSAKRMYAGLAIIGAVVPWLFFGIFFSRNGFDLPLFIQSIFDNPVAAGFAVDIILSIIIFWIWSWRDATRHQIRRWWLVAPASLLVGLSLALPLYLYLREETERE